MDYKKTLEDIVKIINTTEKCDDGFVNICNYIYENYPELSESKDDRIRKGLIALLKFGLEDGSAIAPGFNETKEEALAWLEKQNEQKSSIKVKPKFNIGDQVTNGYYTCKIENIDDTTYYCSDSSFISRFDIKDQDRFELVEQESDFKLKPKFQEGDWIVNNNCGGVYQVTEIRDNEYCLWPLDTEIMGYLRTIDVDNEYHLWTTQDAKDGDILSDGTMIVIFKCIKEPAYSEHIVAYVGLDTFGNIQITDGTWEFGKDKIYPATKEQCDLLFKKMKEVGCKFNDETKKLETL